MGLLDDELKSIKSEYTKKPEWALCKFCRVPFLTSTFSDSCERCNHFIQYKIEFSSKIMIAFILFSILVNITTIISILFLVKITKNYNYILTGTTFIGLMQGLILWKIVKKIMNK